MPIFSEGELFCKIFGQGQDLLAGPPKSTRNIAGFKNLSKVMNVSVSANRFFSPRRFYIVSSLI